jgi:sugar phosphate isomerase/epimerase
MKRSSFIKALGFGTLAAGIQLPEIHATETASSLKIGMASYTLRRYSLDELIEICLRLQIKDIALKSFHLPYEATQEELQYIMSKLKARGLNIYGGGVIYMKTEADVEKYFTYASHAGLPMIIGAPEHHLLKLVEDKVKATGIKLAIHNHGPEDKIFPSAGSVYDKIKDLDSRIGLCIDLGHTYRLGLDPSEEVKKYKDRLFDVHLKDMDKPIPNGQPVEIGRGGMDIPAILRALSEIQYSGIVGLEYEKDGDHAAYGLAESLGYVRGVLKMI